MTKLPRGWVEARFGDINSFVPQSLNPSLSPDEVFELYSVPAFPSGSPEYLSGSAIGSTKQLVAQDDVLVCKINPRINRVWQVMPQTGQRQIASSEWIVMRAPSLDARFLRYYFSSASFRDLICEGVTGVGGSLTRAQPKRVATFGVPIAPHNEQKRIADKLDAVLARVDACRERLDRVPDILKRLREAVLTFAISGELTKDWRSRRAIPQTGNALVDQVRAQYKHYSAENGAARVKDAIRVRAEEVSQVELRALFSDDLPEGWSVARAAEVVQPGAEIVYGIVQPGPKLDEGVPYVRGKDIENGRILVDQLMKTSAKIAEKYARAALAGGDILLGIIRATKVARVPEELNGANITQGTARFRPSSALRSKFLALALEAPATQRWLHRHYRGIDMPGLNLADVRRIPVPIPSLEEQDEIIRRVESIFAYAENLEARYAAARFQVERLTPALFDKAFRGELVPQDPNDEPASVLLERIRAARASAPSKPKRGRAGASNGKGKGVSIPSHADGAEPADAAQPGPVDTRRWADDEPDSTPSRSAIT